MAEQETKQMSGPSSNIIEFDKDQVLQAIETEGQYTLEDILIKKCPYPPEEIDNKELYLASITKNSSRYIGCLNNRFQREGYGVQIFENGDKYFGSFSNDQRNDLGVYFWNPKETEDRVQSECYLGGWCNNRKEKRCVYVWMDEMKEEPSYETSVFDAFLGELENEKYVRGTYLSKSEKDFYLYHGNFDVDGKKNDKNGFFYISQLNRYYHGEVCNDLLVQGYIAYFEADSDEVKELVYCEFNEDGTIKNVIRQKELAPESVEEEINKIKVFRNIMVRKNFFMKTYNRYKKYQLTAGGRFESIEDMEDLGNIQAIVEKLKKYNSDNIFYEIETRFFEREFEQPNENANENYNAEEAKEYQQEYQGEQ